MEMDNVGDVWVFILVCSGRRYVEMCNVGDVRVCVFSVCSGRRYVKMCNVGDVRVCVFFCVQREEVCGDV